MFHVTYRYGGKSVWHSMGIVRATSFKGARNKMYDLLKKQMCGYNSSDCKSHRPVPGRTIYEYPNGAICVERRV